MSKNEEPAAAAGSITQDERERLVESKQENTLAGFKRHIDACFNRAGHAWFEATRRRTIQFPAPLRAGTGAHTRR
jgi:hypothetical protein